MRPSTALRFAAPGLAALAACSSPVAVDVAIVDPCNQDAVATMDFLRFEPRGAGPGHGGSAARKDHDLLGKPTESLTESMPIFTGR